MHTMTTGPCLDESLIQSATRSATVPEPATCCYAHRQLHPLDSSDGHERQRTMADAPLRTGGKGVVGANLASPTAKDRVTGYFFPVGSNGSATWGATVSSLGATDG